MAEKTFQIKIITPDRLFYEGEAEMVEFNTTEGEIGVYREHIPTTVIVRPGVLRIIQGDEVKEAALHAGFAEILQTRVVIMAEVIEWPGEIDEHRALEAKKRAEERLQNKQPGTDVIRAETALARAMARIQVLR